MLNGGKLGNVRILSPKSVELMTHDQLGKIGPEQALDSVSELMELSHPSLNWERPASTTGGIFLYKFFCGSQGRHDRHFHGSTSPEWQFAGGLPSPGTGLSGVRELAAGPWPPENQSER